MPNPKPNTRGLTKGKGRALEALGVEALAEGEATWTIRVRGESSLRERLRGYNPKQIGDILERALDIEVVRPKSDR